MTSKCTAHLHQFLHLIPLMLCLTSSLPEFLKSVCMTAFKACLVPHCQGSFGVSMTFVDGPKIAYSGDCRPSKAFAGIGKDADLLIHEATFDDSMRGDALAKRHSTTSEALGVGMLMRARNVLLTHFSQRYTYIPDFDTRQDAAAVVEDVDEAFSTLPAAASDDVPLQLDNSLRPTVQLPEHSMNVAVAFDHMTVRIADIKHLPAFRDAFQLLYKDDQASD